MEAIHKVCQDADVVNVQNKVESVEYDILCDGEPISLVFDKKDRLLYKESRFELTEELLLKIQKKLEKNISRI